ncbi:type II secretion system protein GspC [Salinimonas sp. HHU 13199]|uniref:Type II secretion system protein GspC n=1 Tax=Salinimonas profundi TaxID=2729140 RepID=A0ABR8LJB0_9ALTE|nr:type II secretion system protein GspC [Salinimonas profundi]MBD3585668.1 type II secretion system protein GspC [Salinimonas profundi]
MTFNKFNYNALTSQLVRHQKVLRLAVVVLLSLYLIAFAARLFWQLWPQPDQPAPPSITNTTGTSTTSSAQNGVNIARLQQLNLFGVQSEAPEAPAEQVTDAPQTSLNLTLTGVVASSIVEDAAAIIENKGTQMVYGLGEKIEGTNVTLHQVQNDRVIIKNGSRNETLMLDGLDYEKANKQRQRSTNRQRNMTPSNPPPTQESATLSREAIEATAALREEPASFTDFISISPKSADGQLVGYQVQPGKNPSLFQSAGLQSGDVIVQINGYDLTDSQQTMTAMNELRSAQSIELTLDRGGEYLTVYLDMPEAGAE